MVAPASFLRLLLWVLLWTQTAAKGDSHQGHSGHNMDPGTSDFSYLSYDEMVERMESMEEQYGDFFTLVRRMRSAVFAASSRLASNAILNGVSFMV